MILGPLGDVLRTSWGSIEPISQGRPFSVRLRRPLDVISGRQTRASDQGVPGKSEQDVLRTLEEDVLGTDFAGRVVLLHIANAKHSVKYGKIRVFLDLCFPVLLNTRMKTHCRPLCYITVRSK